MKARGTRWYTQYVNAITPANATSVSARQLITRRTVFWYTSVPAFSTRLNARKKTPCARSRWCPRKMAESAGVSVSALNAEIETENAIVNANCRNKMPVVPGKSATGTNTDTSTSDVAITAPATSFIATDAALCGSVMPSTMCRSTFSITTMASSTTKPVATVSAISDRLSRL